MKTLIKTCIYLLNIGLITAAHASPLETSAYNNIIYFADDQSTALKRYSLVEEKFLAPITLADTPKAVHVDSAGIYVSYGTRIVKVDFTGANATQIRTTSSDVYDIEATDQYLILAGNDFIQTLSKSTHMLLANADLWYSSPNISLSFDNRQIFYVSRQISPADIRQIPLLSDGTLGANTESPYHGAYFVGENPLAIPNQNRVVDSSGTVYNTKDLTFAGSLGSFYTDIAFWQGSSIVLRENTLHAYNQNLLETGLYKLPAGLTGQKIATYANQVVVFNLDSNSAQRFALDLMVPPAPAVAINPTGLTYTPDSLDLDKNQNTVYLLSKTHRNIFRWSISQAAYLSSIPLSDTPLQMTYSAEQARIYVSYNNGAINYINLADNKEYPFANIAVPLSNIIAADPYLIATGSSGGSADGLNVYNKDGLRTSYLDWFAQTANIAWDSSYGELHFFTPNLNMNADLEKLTLDRVGGFVSAAYINRQYNTPMIQGPIRISTAGKFIAFGDGRVVDKKTMTQQADIDPVGSFDDLTWLHGNLFSLRATDSNSHCQVQRWSADFKPSAEAIQNIEGSPIRLLSLAASGNLILIYSKAGKPQFKLLHYQAADYDTDGHLDGDDAFPTLEAEWQDLDDDGIGDNVDSDDDNDGVPDAQDAFPRNAQETLDTDKDTVGNNTDTDDDNDGISDSQDLFPLDATDANDLDHDGIGDNADSDTDGDGSPNSDDAFPLNRAEWLDLDKDGLGDNSDADIDNDGVLNSQDAFPNNAQETKDLDNDGLGDNSDTDADGDGFVNDLDKFPFDSNDSQDIDEDGIGDNTDPDTDNDGVLNYQDAFPLNPEETRDLDYDGIGDNADADIDGDQVPNSADAFPENGNEWSDADHDGIGDDLDRDDDNDGVADGTDFYPLDASRSALNIADFLPLTAGSSWRYDTSSLSANLLPATTIAGQSITPIQFPTGSKLYLKVVDNQLQFFGFYLPQVATNYGTFKTDFTLTKALSLTATSYNTSGTGNINISPTYGNRTLNWSATVSYLGYENIRVREQQYATIHTRLSFNGSTVIDGATVQLSYNTELWFAENIGIVKIVENGITSQLVSATIAPAPTANTPPPAKGASSGGGSSNWAFLAILLLFSVAVRKQKLL